MKRDLEALRAMRMMGVKSAEFEGEDVVAVEFFDLADDERLERAMEALGESERHLVQSMSDDQRRTYLEARQNQRLYGHSL